MIRSKSKTKVVPTLLIPISSINNKENQPSLPSLLTTKHSARGPSKFNSQSILLRNSRSNKKAVHHNHKHRFHKKTFPHPTWCQYANKFIWGLNKSGYECRDCGLAVSRRFIGEAKTSSCGECTIDVLRDVSSTGWKQVDQAYRSTVFTIYLPHGAKKSVILNPKEKLKTVLQKVCIERGININEFVAEDTHGAVVQLETPLGLISESKITFTKREIKNNPDHPSIDDRPSPREKKIVLPDLRKITRNFSNGYSTTITRVSSLNPSKSPRHSCIDAYEIGKELGSGAFSVVKAATHKVTQEVIAIKILDKYDEDDEETKKFRKEIKTLSSLHHENITQFYRLEEDDENFYVIMELVGGGELFDYIINNTRVKEPEAVCLVAQVCKAVEYMHSVGIIHRDLKPENLLFKDSDHKVIKIADFGESKSFKDGKLNTYCGTPDYMAPEIIRGEAYGSEVDIWSIGVITYVMLSGYPPFDGENDIQVFASILSIRYDFPSPEWDILSTSSKEFIQSILIENPKQRLTASGCLLHPWIMENVPLEQRTNTWNVKSPALVSPTAHPAGLKIIENNNIYSKKLVRIKSDNSVPSSGINTFDYKRTKNHLKQMVEEIINREEGVNEKDLGELKVILQVLDTTGAKWPISDFEKVIYQIYHKRIVEIQNQNQLKKSRK